MRTEDSSDARSHFSTDAVAIIAGTGGPAMIDARGRYQHNTIVLDKPLDLREGQEVVVRVEVVPAPAKRPPRVPGLLKGKIELAPDFDATPEGFEEYMP